MAIVCDLPVPGGPCTTKFLPALTSSTTMVCEASASKMCSSSPGENLSSIRSSLLISGLVSSNEPPNASLTSGLPNKPFLGQLSGSKSRSIASLANLKPQSSIPSTSISQSGFPEMASLTSLMYFSGLKPSSGISISGRSISKSVFSLDLRLRFVAISSSLAIISKVDVFGFRIKFTGKSISGASRSVRFRLPPFSSFHFRKPIARYRILKPISSSADLASA